MQKHTVTTDNSMSMSQHNTHKACVFTLKGERIMSNINRIRQMYRSTWLDRLEERDKARAVRAAHKNTFKG